MKNVHEYSVDRATQTARLGATNPARKWVFADSTPVIAQLSHGELHFYDQGGQPLAVEDVPEEILAALKKSPLRKGNETPEQVVSFCPFCPENSNAVASGAYAKHLEDHIRSNASSARKVAEEPEAFATTAADVTNVAPKAVVKAKTAIKSPRKSARRKAKK